VRLEPLAGYEYDVRRVLNSLADTPPNASESAQKWVHVARLVATAWQISIGAEANRFSVNLPELPRRALQLPQIWRHSRALPVANSRRLLGLGLLWAVSWGEKKGGLGFSAKMMTEDMEGIEGVAKSAGHLFGGRPSSR